jgi:serine/threonine protein kinase
VISTGQRFAAYELVELVGDGDMGMVFKARDVRLGRWVALRIVAHDLARDPVVRARLNRESTLLASLDHPHVAPIYDAGEHDGRLFIATRWVDGPNLAALVGENGPLEPRRAVRIVNQAASALQAAHGLGMMHRNVKPSSILVAANDLAYLTDFGLARRRDDMTGLTAEQHLLDTYDYVVPEYISGADVDARVDIYGLGCAMYTALTAEVPYPRSGAAAKMYAHLSADPPSAHGRNPSVPEQLDAVVRRAMAKAPDDRQQTAAEFALEAAGAVGLSAPLWATREPHVPSPDPTAPAAQPAVADRAERDPTAPAAGEPASDGASEAEFYEPAYYVDRRPVGRRILFWTVAVLVFLAAPVALLIALLH